jgi:rSAM/selenodomain-associated transferase 2
VISAVVPTWQEAGRVGAVVRACAAVADEVVVADAWSADGTAAEADAAGARVIQARKGRGPQLNAGAGAARGDVLLFVHADTEVPESAGAAIRTALTDPMVVGGNFRLRFVPETPMARLYSLGNHVRRVALGLYYGDSCIFVRRRVFEALGGFRDYPVFEDYDFVCRLERAGRTRYVADVEVRSSARRFARQPLRTLAVWAALQAGYTVGLSPARLGRYYADLR